MTDYTTDRYQNDAQPLTAGEIQARINLQQVARYFLGDGLPGGDVQVYLIPQFNPDHAEYHIFRNYFRNPVTGDRGSSIKFIQRVRRCNYGQAVAYLAGWLDGMEAGC
jgi:hypothetical protein